MEKYITYIYKLLCMTVKKELESVQDKLNINSKNNILNRQLNIIQDSVKTNRDKEDTTSLRRERTRTNHEMGSAEHPLDTGSETYIEIPRKSIEKITDELNSIKNSLNKIIDEYTSHEAKRHSNTFERFHNCVYSVLDELNYMFYETRKKEPTFALQCKKINKKNNVSEDDVNKILSELDEFRERIQYLFEQIVNVSVPDDNKIMKEIEESRLDMIEKEMDEYGEYFENR